METYLFWKALHFFGIIIFLGNIIVTGVWKVLADRTKNPQIIAYAQRLVTITDYLFTALGVILIFVSGRMMAVNFGGISGSYWLAWGWGMFIVSGVIWLLILIPVQIKQAKLAKQFQAENSVPNRYLKLSRIWYFAGVISTVLPLLNLYFMVYKPS